MQLLRRERKKAWHRKRSSVCFDEVRRQAEDRWRRRSPKEKTSRLRDTASDTTTRHPHFSKQALILSQARPEFSATRAERKELACDTRAQQKSRHSIELRLWRKSWSNSSGRNFAIGVQRQKDRTPVTGAMSRTHLKLKLRPLEKSELSIPLERKCAFCYDRKWVKNGEVIPKSFDPKNTVMSLMSLINHLTILIANNFTDNSLTPHNLGCMRRTQATELRTYVE